MRALVLVAFALATMSVCPGAGAAEASANTADLSTYLQQRHDRELRAQLVAAGRFDEARELDARIAQRARTEREKSLARFNESVSAARTAGSPQGNAAAFCIPR